MATRQMQKVLSPRNRSTSLDTDRENFEKGQVASISKAINNNEGPVKEKHVRRIIIGTFQDKGAATYWSIVRRMPLQENPIVCWKFCHVFHKILREGHRKVIADSYQYRAMILDLGKMWGMLKEGYGKLIQNYCTLLVNKIEFHARNVKFPGSLQVTDEELDNIGERDVNVFFQLSCEIFDYLDEILCLQATIFGSLDMSRANSMTSSGQCRLAPLIACIQDSSQLYDYSVKVLFKLHAALPSGTLDGHRDRFLSQFKILRKFYINSSNLQYFRRLIQVPLLPDTPPNFLLASDIDSHVTPVVILPTQNDSPDGSEVDNLIDISIPSKSDDTSSIWSFQTETEPNISGIIEEKDRMIARLMSRIEELEMSIQQTRIEDGHLIGNLRKRLMELECESVEHDRSLKAMIMDRDNSQKEAEELRQEVGRLQIGTDLQTEAAKANEKFTKLKEIYGKLREEHINLLRLKAEIEKEGIELKSSNENLKVSREDCEAKLRMLQTREIEKNDSFRKLSECMEKLNVAEAKNKKLLTEMALLQQEKLGTESKLSDSIRTLTSLRQDFDNKEKEHLSNLNQKDWHYLDLVLRETQLMAKNVQQEDAVSGNVHSTPEYFFAQGELLNTLLARFLESVSGLKGPMPDFDGSMTNILQYFHQLCYLFNCGKVLYNTLPNMELGQDLMNRCKELTSLSSTCNQQLLDRNEIDQSLNHVKNCLDSLLSMKTIVLPELAIDENKNLEEMLMAELSDMDKAIQDAANRIEQMMKKSKTQDTGLKLEVNEKILDACTGLMQAIMELIKNSKELQKEIVGTSKGNLPSKEFYQRNHRWTEGLISAAKVVATGAKLLVDSADKVVGGNGKLEEVMVASQEIAGAVAQLVVASRVKASPKSEKMSKVSKSSKKVTEATGSVVGTVKNCRELIEEKDTLDFSGLNLHQAKRLEMESQVRLIQLESDVTKERMKLSSLRKQHYHLGAMAEGGNGK